MANVLPPPNQKNILRTQRTRFLFVFAEVALALAVAFYVVLLPSYLGLTLHGARVDKDKAAAASTTSYTTLMRETKGAVVQLEALVKATSTPSELLSAILAEKPAGVSITTLSYTSGKPGKIVVSASADQSELIQAYRGALQAGKQFDSVAIPASALVGSADGAFIITLSGVF